MTDPNQLQYQTPAPYSNDISHLQILSILHYVWGGLLMLLSCFFIIYIVMGFVMASGAFNASVSAGRTASQPPPPSVGYVLVGFGSCGVVCGWGIGICTIISGYKMATRKSRVFSIVMAGINCISFPLGTTLGVFTIIVLAKQSIKELYAAAA
jgi:hypothetical protein